MEKEERRRKRRGKSASGELDGPLTPPRPTIFEEVEKPAADEFEPVRPGEPHVEWEDDEEYGMAEERFEALLETLFADPEEDVEFFEDVSDGPAWSEGEVIWEGMDFDQMFSDPGEFHAFELLSRRDQRRFIREHLRTQEASGAAEPVDGETELDPKKRERPHRDGRPRSKAGPPTGPLVSTETETEHRADDLDLGISPDGRRRRRRR